MSGFTPIDAPTDHTMRRGHVSDDRTEACGPVVVNLADVQPEPVRWLWPGRFALGKLTLVAGDPGLGKSLVTLDMAARLSTGTPWPDAPHTPNEPGGVVLLSAEDDAADTIRPRMDAAGADVHRVNLIFAVRRRPTFDPARQDQPEPVEAMFDLTRDLSALGAAIEETPDCRLVVIDPITAYLGGTDSHKNAELRGLLAPLSDLASQRRVAVIAVTHLNKNAGGPAIYRSMGSVAFTAAARAVWAVTKDKDNPRRRLVLPVKNNLAADVLGMAYTIETTESGEAAIVAWEPDPVELSADEALGPDGGDAHDGDDAESWLREALSDGELPAAEVLRQARANGFNDKATRKAFKAIGAKRRREGFGRGGTWHWSLSDPMGGPIVGIDSPISDGGNNGNNGGNDDDWAEL